MGTLVFKSPKDPVAFKNMLDTAKVKVIRDNLVIQRAFIVQQDGLLAIENGCKARIVQVYSNKNKDYDIVILGHKFLDFSSLMINYKGLGPFMIINSEDITNYLNS